MLPHEKLHVYRKALAFVAAASELSAGWEKKHAVVDQFARAASSVILNLAEAARLRSVPSKLRTLDYSLGSTLECASCLDIARIKSLLDQSLTEREKGNLSEIAKMLVGLRRAWQRWRLQEDPTSYVTSKGELAQPLFHHETLQVYRMALGLIEWFAGLPGGEALSCRLYRQLDETLTGIVLNIAEGNGRYSELDHRHFLDLAECATIKAAACTDLAVQNRILAKTEGARGKTQLERVFAMLRRM